MTADEVTYQIQHDLTKEHVFQSTQCIRVILRAEVLESLKEVRISSGIILVFCVKDTRLQIELRLEVWWAVYRVGSSSGRCQGGLGDFHPLKSARSKAGWRGHTLAFAKFPIPLYTLLSNK